MDRFDAVLLSLLSSNETWNNPNWDYSGIQDVKPSLDGLSVKEQLEVLRKYHGRFAEWRCRIPGSDWKTVRLVENPDKTVSMTKTF